MNQTAVSESPAPAGLNHIGLIAGEGDFPHMLARAARSRMIHVTAIGIRGITSPELAEEVDAMHWVEFGQFGKVIEYCHESQVMKAVMAGRIRHNSIFQLRKLDMRGVKLLARTPRKTANALLGAITEEFARENIEIIDSTIFLRECMPAPGLLTPRCQPDENVLADIEFARPIADQLAEMDIGQTLVVRDGTIVAVEAMEGTNLTIIRAGEVAGDGCTVIKTCKPSQDSRFDVPVLGLTTIKKLIQSRCQAIAFPGNEVLFFELEDSIELAQSRGITIYAW
jgi:DUF1009 family protein